MHLAVGLAMSAPSDPRFRITLEAPAASVNRSGAWMLYSVVFILSPGS
jgi:hypothetical protein